MAGIYIHIPFCKQKCHYCNFFSVASIKQKALFLDALKTEIKLQKDYLNQEKINTVYFGGGTPSILSVEELNILFEELNKFHNISDTAEITLEANPDDLDSPKIKEISGTFINRLSIGVQSFFKDDLNYLNRIHNAEEAKECIKLAQDYGFTNMSIDLIYGIPGLSMEKWRKNLEYFFESKIPHLSAYSLTVEPRTALDLLIRKKKLAAVVESESIAHFEELIKQSQENGFTHYEISNFGKEGYYSQHNSLYWLGGHYLGLGPSAHSYNGISRQWNVSNITKYISMDNMDSSVVEKEILSKDQQFNEYIMTSLRTSWGCNLEHVKNVFGFNYFNHLVKQSQKYLQEGKIFKENNILYLSQQGRLYADGIAADLFIA